MIRSLLVANRGEIARRVIRTARRMGIRTVAVHSDVDAALPFVMEADQAVRLGHALPVDTYLRGDLILAAARETGAEAIHPGYGFLSENAEFAEAVEAAGLIWVGAPPAAIRAMGLKDAAKRLMDAAGVPTTPGYLGDDQSVERLSAEAARIGWPVLIKAVAGGGGKGMRRVDRADGFAAALAGCRREAAAAFGDDRVLLERYILNPRHIEVQVFGDRHGDVVHLFERDCSLQRRHQKVVEEAPAPGMDPDTRASLCAAAVRAARAVHYVGAGTVEFIADGSGPLRADRIWFMEMNTRLQVEHPVTEAITGQDLVEWQLRVASGEPLPRRQDQLMIEGWAVEARLYAEDPARDFLPSVGRIDAMMPPAMPDVRVDAGVAQGNGVSPFYDPMIAKLVAHAPTRTGAIGHLTNHLDGLLVWPLKTNSGFLARILRHPAFVEGRIDTGLLARSHDELVSDEPVEPALLAAVVEKWAGVDRPADLWAGGSGFRLNAAPSTTVPIHVDGREIAVPLTADSPRAVVTGQWIAWGPDAALVCQRGVTRIASLLPAAERTGPGAGDGAILSPMPGRVVAVEVASGDRVEAGQRLVVVEAMKMEQALVAPFAGTVAVMVEPGLSVVEGALLAQVEAAPPQEPDKG